MTTSTNRRGRAALGAGLASILAGGALIATAYTANALPVEEPIFHEGNKTCEDLGYETLTKVDPPESVDNDWVTVTLSEDGMSIDVEVKPGVDVDAVLVKGGPGTNEYQTPPFEDLVAPVNPGEQPPQISHYDICGTETEPSETPSETPTETPTETPSETPTPTPTQTGDDGGMGGDVGDDDGVGGDTGDIGGMGGDNGTDEGEALPDTGAGSAGLLGAAALLALGGGLVLMSRRALGSEA